MKIVINIDDTLVNDLAQLLGVEPTADAISNHYTESIGNSLATKQVGESYQTTLQNKKDELKTKITSEKN